MSECQYYEFLARALDLARLSGYVVRERDEVAFGEQDEDEMEPPSRPAWDHSRLPRSTPSGNNSGLQPGKSAWANRPTTPRPPGQAPKG